MKGTSLIASAVSLLFIAITLVFMNSQPFTVQEKTIMIAFCFVLSMSFFYFVLKK